MRCEVCGGEFGHGDIRVGVAVPVWLDRNGWGQKTEPYALGAHMDVCNGCYEGATVLHGSGDGTVTFEPFPGTEHTTGRAVAEKKRGERREFDEEFWLRLVTDEDGALSKEKVLAELHDYSVLLDIVPKVYDEVTGGHASNPFTVPEVVCWLVEGRIERRVDEALEGAGHWEFLRAHREERADGAWRAEIERLERESAAYEAQAMEGKEAARPLGAVDERARAEEAAAAQDMAGHLGFVPGAVLAKDGKRYRVEAVVNPEGGPCAVLSDENGERRDVWLRGLSDHGFEEVEDV